MRLVIAISIIILSSCSGNTNMSSPIARQDVANSQVPLGVQGSGQDFASTCSTGMVTDPRCRNALVEDACNRWLGNKSIRGTDIEKLIASLSKISLKKDAFETTNEYNARISERINDMGSVLTSIDGENMAVFRINIKIDPEQYNADTGIITIGRADGAGMAQKDLLFVGSAKRKVVPGFDWTFLFVGGKSTITNHIGQTSLGVASRFSMMTGHHLDVGFLTRNGTDGFWGWPKGTFQLVVGRSEARAAMDKVYMVVIGKLMEPYIDNSNMLMAFEPTLRYPHGMRSESTAVIIDIKCAGLVYDLGASYGVIYQIPTLSVPARM